MEPTIGDEQFDFVIKDSNGIRATQVKSTVNSFIKSDVTRWAAKMEAARHGESCRLLLVGLVPASLDHVTHIGAVALERKNLDLTGLLREAAQLLAVFLEAEGVHAGTGQQREVIVHALVSKLQHFATKSTPLSREEFVKLLREWISSAPKDGKSIALSHFDVSKYAPAELIGRENETKLLSDAWNQAILGEKGRPRILTFVALGGEGKTSLVAKWAADLAAQDWPGCDAAFAWSFYSQGTREQMAASSDLFLKEVLTFFGDEAMAGSAAGAFEKGRRLAQLVGERRALLILDGLEPLQYALTAPTPGELKDQGLAALLKGLAATSHGLCVVTTRYSLPDHRRLYEHLCASAPDKSQPTLEDPQPLYQAVAHGCEAGQPKASYLKVYRARIRPIPGVYPHDGRDRAGSELVALASFFEKAWGEAKPCGPARRPLPGQFALESTSATSSARSPSRQATLKSERRRRISRGMNSFGCARLC